MLFWKKKSKPQETTESVSIDRENIPQHIAVIMDGNGRWANAIFLELRDIKKA